MDDELFISIIKYFEDRTVPKNKDTKESLVQWSKLVAKYKLVKEFLVYRGQPNRSIIPKSQYYPLIYTFHNDPTAGYLRYKKVLQKLSERYYWPGMVKNVN